ncbi:MAG TPA: efflux RND transporter permease subunit [Acidimicrobiia bacterium]
MMRAVIASSLTFRLLVVVAAAGMIVAGVAHLRQTPLDVYPEFTPPSVEIQTEALGLSASEVEQLITVPLEADLLNGVAWLDTIRSESIPGLSSITLIFEPGTDLLRARQMTQERLNQPAAIPSVSKAPVMLAPVSSTSRTMMIGLSSERLSLIDMSVLARWTVRPRLMGVPGVANVAIYGQRDRQLQVQVDPQRLRDHGVTLDQVISTTGNSLWVSSLSFLEASTPGTGGFFDAPNQRLAVRHVSPIITPTDLGGVAVEPAADRPPPVAADGTRLRLTDVTDVVEDHQPLIGDAIVDGKPGLMLVVEKLPTAHTLEVTQGIDEALDALRPGLAGIKINRSVFRPATFIHNAIHDLGLTLLIGFGLMILALALLFYQWRTALVAVAAVITSLVAAAFVLSLAGSTINTLVFAGFAVGLAVVIDDAIVGAESVARRLGEHRRAGHDPSLPATVLEATLKARAGLAFATVIIVLPLLPVFFLTGLGREFGRPLALSYGLALAASLVVAMTVTPAVAVTVFSKAPLARRESPVMGWLARRYQTLLSRLVGNPRLALVAVAALALTGVLVVPQVRQSPVPTFKETDFLIDMDGPPGTSLPEMDRITTKAIHELGAIPGVRAVAGHVGRAVTSDKVLNPNSSVLWVSVSPRADYDRTVGSIRAAVAGYPGIDTDVMTYSEARLREVKTGADEAVVVRLFGQDLDVLRTQAGEVKQALSGVRGLEDLHAELPRQEPTLSVEVNLEAAKAAGIKPGDVRRAAATLLSGVQVGSLFEEQKVFDVVVWGTPGTRQNISTMRELLIDTPDGGYVRLGDVAKVEVKPSPSVIERDSVSRRVDVSANVVGRARADVLDDVRARLEGVDFPLEYHYELVGDYADRQVMAHRLLVIGIAAAIGIFLLLQAGFRSWRLAALSFLTLPVALVGGAAAVLLDGGTLELGSLVGFLAVLALAVRHGVLLLKRYQQLERQEGQPFGADLVLGGARDRLAPMLLTTIATALVFAPFVLLGDLPGHEIVNPMGGVILGGLVTSTVLNLFLLPALYLRFGQGDVEELDLRELWEEPAPEVEVDVTERVLVGTEPGAGPGTPEALQS